MKIEQRQVGTVDVFAPVGALVEDDAQDFCRRLRQRMQLPNIRIVLSFEEVPYVDSVALEGLLQAAADMGERGSELKLAGVTPTCREILELTGLSNHFRLFGGLQDAVRSFL
ncbi:MAG: STAS domain-containing protein [Planctomycetota bacterium]